VPKKKKASEGTEAFFVRGTELIRSAVYPLPYPSELLV
jgi:hypothetical protein